MDEVRDLRNIPLSELTLQEINGRIAIIYDRVKELGEERLELTDMLDTLTEQRRRLTQK